MLDTTSRHEPPEYPHAANVLLTHARNDSLFSLRGSLQEVNLVLAFKARILIYHPAAKLSQPCHCASNMCIYKKEFHFEIIAPFKSSVLHSAFSAQRMLKIVPNTTVDSRARLFPASENTVPYLSPTTRVQNRCHDNIKLVQDAATSTTMVRGRNLFHVSILGPYCGATKGRRQRCFYSVLK